MPAAPPPLPIDPVLPALAHALRAAPAAVLLAPPGAGKTTRVPLALLDEPWLGGRKILMLEPRRLAARAAARRMAATLGESVGGTVGYRVRLDTRVGPRTRIEVVTEGILTRFLQEDPALESAGLVIFDEFHERSLHADLGLALALQSQQLLREDLRLLVMSATLDGAAVARLCGAALPGGHAPVVTSEGRGFPVEVRYTPRRPELRVEPAAAQAVRAALAEDDGDVLVFLPGAGEIRRTASMLADGGLPPGVDLHELHGTLPPEAQDRAILPSPEGRRKVVLATSIAETSLTIEGVRVVIDAGLARVPRFSPRSGMTRLETVRVSRAASEQRCGRAGRTAPGVCRRLWAEAEQAGLVPQARPEILEADLAPLALELAAGGVADPLELRWLDPPPAAAYAQARTLLAQLGALDAAGPEGRVTPHGRRMAELALHPRLAHMVLRGAELGLGAEACAVAALLEDRDLLRGEPGSPAPADLRLRLEVLTEMEAGRGAPRHAAGLVVDRDRAHRAREEARHWRQRLGLERADAARAARAARWDAESAGLLLAFAFPDRIAQRRGHSARYLLRNGRGAVLPAGDALASSPYLVAADIDDRGAEGRIWLAAPVTLEALEAHAAEQLETEEEVGWDAAVRAVRAWRRERLGAIVLREEQVRDPDPALVQRALLDAVRADGLGLLAWPDGARRVQQRILFLRALEREAARAEDGAWPDVSDAALLASLDEWLAPHLAGVRRLDDLQRLDVAQLLLGLLPWDRRAALDTLAPTHLEVPTGSRIAIDYADPAAPVLAVRLQELFGLAETPRIAGGRVPLTLHLLSPAHRPVQVTRDLAGFWRGSYFDVRKDLRGRYPKHYWPDDPLQAEPTRRAKPRGT